MKLFKKVIVALAVLPLASYSQGFLQNGKVHGSFQIDGQYYQDDKDLGITEDDINGKLFGLNGFGKINYTNGDFEAGMRYEAFMPVMSGYEDRFTGNGIPFWFASYHGDKIDITVGDFYEQFGNGLTLRSYEEWTLGYDNSLRGMRVRFNPYRGIHLKGVVGKHRYFWDKYDESRATVRGFDAEVAINELIPSLEEAATRITFGGSVVSKFQETEGPVTVVGDHIFQVNVPKNVGSYAGRMSVSNGPISFNAEYARKMNDPNTMNKYIFKEGQALMGSVSYSTKGFGAYVAAKWIDNMSEKSSINENKNFLDVNFLPPIAYQHTYTLATIYPYSTQPNGEAGIQGQISYTIPRKSLLGGKYGTNIEVNFSRVNSIQRDSIMVGEKLTMDQMGTEGYESKFLSIGDEEYFQDVNIFVTHKFNKSFKLIAGYANMHYNISVIEGHAGDPLVKSNLALADMTYKISRKTALRLELQRLFTDQDKGDWMLAMAELSFAPHWTLTLMDQYNDGNKGKDKQVHYYTGGFAWVKDATRVQLTYGRQRDGLVCVGGVCRYVPASKGFAITITSSF